MIDYEHCPRCGNDWYQRPIVYFLQCTYCNIKYDTKYQIFYLNNIIDGYMLSWWIKSQTSYFERSIPGEIIEFPLLDFSISPEKLKLYLLFS